VKFEDEIGVLEGRIAEQSNTIITLDDELNRQAGVATAQQQTLE